MIQEFTQEMKNLIQDMIRDVHTMIPGKIVTFDPAVCEASVLPFGKFKKPDGGMIDYPQINRVPVYVMQSSGQTATMAFPIKPGDECIILFSEQALDTWRTKSESNTDLRFDLSNAMAIVGMFSRPNPLVAQACSTDAIIIERSGSRITLQSGGKVDITGDTTIKGDTTIIGDTAIKGSLTVDGDINNTGNMKTGGTHTDSVGVHIYDENATSGGN